MKYLTRDNGRLDFSRHSSLVTRHSSPFTRHSSPVTCHRGQPMSAKEWIELEEEVAMRVANPGVSPLEEIRNRSGLEFLRDIISGTLPFPPIGKTLNFFPVEAEEGRVVFQGTPTFDFYNPIGTVHGGWAATLLDSCMGCAMQTHTQERLWLHDRRTQGQHGAADERQDRPRARGRQGHPPRPTGGDFRRASVRAGRETLCARHDDMRHL